MYCNETSFYKEKQKQKQNQTSKNKNKKYFQQK